MTSSASAAIAALLAPRNVALIGASERGDSWSPRVWRNLQRFGYAGGVFPVNPSRSQIWGTRCYATLSELPEKPDHLALFVPADMTLPTLEAGATAGARSATIYAAGFGEGSDPAGRARFIQLQEFARKNDFAIAGPNCMGIAAAHSRFCTFADENLQELAEGAVAVVAQSGALCSTINRGINDAGLRTAYLLSCGNQAGITIADYLDYLANDPSLRVILCYIEHIPAADKFFAAARDVAAAGKTVVALKIGGSEAGRKAALAHTGALAGAADVFVAFARAAGIVSVDTIEDAITAVTYLARLPRPKGRRVAVMTNSGAIRSLGTEAVARNHLALAEYDIETVERLRAALGERMPSNPLDTKRTLPTDLYMSCVEALAASAQIDSVLIAEELPAVPGVTRKLANLNALNIWAAQHSSKGDKTPVALFTPLALAETDYARSLQNDLPHVPVLKGMEAAFRVISALATPTRSSATPAASRNRAFAEDPFEQFRRRFEGGALPRALNEPQSKALLACYGIPITEEVVVTDSASTILAANRLGYPVVVKGIASAVAHKSDRGLVLLNIADAKAVEEAVDLLQKRTAAASIELEGLLVARQVASGIETVLGIHRDIEMGAVVMFGMGGIWLELFRDVSFAPPGLDRAMAEEMVKRTRVSRLLAGYRDAPPADTAALLDALVCMGRMAQELPDFVESVEVNPFILGPVGGGGYAADALVVFRNGHT
jgi:acetyltransferase